ncbi:L-threonylcarbamoyladenylate synthase [Chloroflexota bacterium]
MQTQIVNADSKESIKLAADVIRSGGLVAFPTETVYGLGADATNEAAVAKIFAVKNRPTFDPLIVHVTNIEMPPLVVSTIPESARLLIDAFWPGPLTIVLRKTEEIPDIVTAGLHTVAVRMPRNDSALALINEARVPIAAPSANSFGYPSPTRVEHVITDLGGKIDLILNGGITQVGVESTVLDLTCAIPCILRPGGVSWESLTRVLGQVSISSEKEGGVLKSPGQMKQHYAPRAKMLLFGGKCREKVIETMRERIAELKKGSRIGIMVPEEEFAHFTDTDGIVIGLGSFATMEQVARELFATMRALDNRGVNYIFALAPPKEGLGLAVFDRLFKASGSQVIEVD